MARCESRLAGPGLVSRAPLGHLAHQLVRLPVTLLALPRAIQAVLAFATAVQLLTIRALLRTTATANIIGPFLRLDLWVGRKRVRRGLLVLGVRIKAQCLHDLGELFGRGLLTSHLILHRGFESGLCMIVNYLCYATLLKRCEGTKMKLTISSFDRPWSGAQVLIMPVPGSMRSSSAVLPALIVS